MTPQEIAQTDEAERRVNLGHCLDGNYAILCKRSLLTPQEAAQADSASAVLILRTA